MDLKFDFNDITILPAITSKISSRSEINARYKDGCLPLCTAPMDMVINNLNKKIFHANNIRVVLPRGETSDDGREIISVSLSEIIELYDNGLIEDGKGYLIDIANGHMEKLVYTIKILKKDFPNIFLIVGNIAHPETYRVLSEAGADGIRVGIGGGGNCTTSANLGVHYPMGSLIKECYDISCTMDNPALIIADGGMKNYSDIMKALVLGADYVMIGGIFNRCIESAGDNYLFNRIKIPQWLAYKCYTYNLPIYKKMRGMSTKEVQRDWGKTELKTSEGTVSRNKVQTDLSRWTENFEDYLKSVMSYTGCYNLGEFKNYVKYIRITDNAFKRFNK